MATDGFGSERSGSEELRDGFDAETELAGLDDLPDRPVSRSSSRQRTIRIAAIAMCVLMALPVLGLLLAQLIG